MAEQQNYDFVAVKAQDVYADHLSTYRGFNTFITWSIGITVVTLILLYLIWG